MTLSVIERCDPLRSEVEDYVRRVFARQHGATIRGFPDRLVAVLGTDRTPLCAAGVRTVEEGFFSEFYLPSSIETVLGNLYGAPVKRSQVIEVTSLASDRSGHAFRLLDYITQLGRDEGKTWGVFTATEKLRRCLERSGLSLAVLGTASAAAVPNRDDWGRYYDARPMVCAMRDRHEQPISFRPPRGLPFRGRQLDLCDPTVMEAKPFE